MTNEFLDMLQSLDVYQTFHFVPPDKVYFEREIFQFPMILHCRAVHTDLDTLPAGVYHEYLKPLALAEIMEDIAAYRGKYDSLSTPFGEIRLRAQDLKAEADRLRQLVQERIDATPPDHLIHIF
jgi:hypothetical protein